MMNWYQYKDVIVNLNNVQTIMLDRTSLTIGFIFPDWDINMVYNTPDEYELELQFLKFNGLNNGKS